MLKIEGHCRICGKDINVENRFCEDCDNSEFRGLDYLFSPFRFSLLGWGYKVMLSIIKEDPKLLIIKARRGGFKSVFANLIALYNIVYNKNFVLFASVSGEICNQHIRFIRREIQHSKLLNEISRTTDKKSEVEFENEARVIAIPQSEKTQVGYHPNIKIIDEASRMRSDFYHTVLRQMGSGIGAKEIILSTPFGSSSFFGELWNNPPRDAKLINIETDDCWWFSKEDLKIERERSPSLYLYNQESLGLFQSAINRVFLDEDIKAAKVEKIDWVNKNLVMGIDFARKVDFTAVTIYDSERQSIVFCDRIPMKVNLWKDKLNLIRDLCKTYNVRKIYGDATGIGDVLVESLKDLPIEGIVFTQNSKIEMYNRLQLLFKNKLIHFTENEKLEEELRNIIFYDDSFRKLGASFENQHDDIMDSLVLAVREAQPIFGGTTQSSWSRVIY